MILILLIILGYLLLYLHKLLKFEKNLRNFSIDFKEGYEPEIKIASITHVKNGYRRFNDSNKYVHRYIMTKKIGRKLRTEERVHHINGNKLDNRPENLRLFSNQKQHHLYHLYNKTKSGFWYENMSPYTYYLNYSKYVKQF